jgi:hypothetical protein
MELVNCCSFRTERDENSDMSDAHGSQIVGFNTSTIVKTLSAGEFCGTEFSSSCYSVVEAR